MSLKQILQKTNKIWPILAAGFTIDAWAIAKEEQNARLNMESETIHRLSLDLKQNQDIIIANQDSQNKINALSSDAIELVNNIKNEGDKINSIRDQLKETKLNLEEQTNLLNKLNYHIENQRKSLEAVGKDMEQIKEVILENKPDESSIYNYLSELINWFRELLSTLNTEQLAALANIMAYIIILMCLFSIISIIYGEFLINYFKLEEKFPKLEKIIQFRRKFLQYYLFLNFLIILLTLFFFISFNLVVIYY